MFGRGMEFIHLFIFVSTEEQKISIIEIVEFIRNLFIFGCIQITTTIRLMEK